MKCLRRVLALLLAVSLSGQQTAQAASVFTTRVSVPSVVPALQLPGALNPSAGLVPAVLSPTSLSPSIQLFVPAAPEVAAAAQLDIERLAAPQVPEASATSAKADLDSRWDGHTPAPSESFAVEAEPSAVPSLAPSQPSSPSGRRIPAPKVLLSRAAVVSGWLGLSALASLTHAPYDRLAPLVIALILSPALSFMWIVMAGSMQQAVREPAAPPTGPPAEGQEAEVLGRLTALAASVGLPAPKRFSLVDSELLQAQAGGTPDDYEVRIYRGLLQLPQDQQEAVMRHELGHVTHRDSGFSGLNMLLAPLAPAIAMTSGIISDPRGWWAVPFAAAAVAAWGAVKKLDEFHADQFAAHTQGTAKPLAQFFKDDIVRRDAEPATKLRRLWEKVLSVASSHPSHERRIARLEELER